LSGAVSEHRPAGADPFEKPDELDPAARDGEGLEDESDDLFDGDADADADEAGAAEPELDQDAETELEPEAEPEAESKGKKPAKGKGRRRSGARS